MIELRKSDERGGADYGWLKTKHTFSFAHYFDPRYLGFRDLRVINEDRIEGGQGFPTHPHRDMEIVTIVIEGALEHKDSIGNTSVIQAGEVQRMSAGRGIYHSEYNHLKDAPTKLFQIWIQTDTKGLDPQYEQKSFAPKDGITLVVSKEGEEGSVKIHQNTKFWLGDMSNCEKKHSLSLPHAWVHCYEGELEVNGQKLEVGDAAAITDEKELQLKALKSSTKFFIIELN